MGRKDVTGAPRLLSQLCLMRHGQTAWSLSGQHTGRTDIPLTEQGEQVARKLAERLSAVKFSRVFTEDDHFVSIEQVKQFETSLKMSQ
ncbi:histidine phosphatase family protein [Bradyrhizobium sp. th.b2]|uniref:histidine phosphatase family protein n=1 Tax=Bradyrhizobium sp. th-b2 TaxID=172088 RepID=UPI0003FF3633